MKDFKEAAERYAATFINVTNINDRDNICKDFIAGAEYGYSESVKEVSREGEPSTQGGEERELIRKLQARCESVEDANRNQFAHLEVKRKQIAEQKAEIERLKQENERLKEYFGNLLASYEQYGEIPSNVMTKAKQALNPKD